MFHVNFLLSQCKIQLIITNLKSALEVENYYIKYAPKPTAYVLGQFVNSSGNVTSNPGNNYATVRYDVENNEWFNFILEQVYITSSTYCVIAFYQFDGTFISGILSSRFTSGTYNYNIKGLIPSQASYIIVSYAGFSSLSNYVNNFWTYGRTPTEKQTIIANGRWNNNNTLQYYLSIPNSSNSSFIAVNGKITVSSQVKISSCDFYYATYGANYEGRQLFRHITDVEHTDNVIPLAYNSFTGTSMPSSSSAYIGVVINIVITPPTTSTGASAIQNMGIAPSILSNVTINNVPITNVHYPAGPVYANFGLKMNEGYNPLLGARICCLGDSLTAVYYKTEEESWPYLIAKWNNAQVDNLGVSGCPLTQYNYDGTSISSRAANLTASKYYTHIFVMAGANDYNLNAPIGQNADTTNTTFKGAINYTIDQLTAKFPYSKIVFATTYRRNVNYNDKPYADAMLEVCALRSIPCLNNYENSGVRFFDEDWMAQFGATNELGNNHLNNAGDLFVAPRFEHALKYGAL